MLTFLAGLFAVFELAPGPGVPLDLPAQARGRLQAELATHAIDEPANLLRALDNRAGVTSRMETETERATKLRREFSQDATSALKAALSAAQEGYVSLYAPELMAELEVDLGQLLLENQPAEARAAFLRARDLTPAWSPSPARTNPTARAAFEATPTPSCPFVDAATARRAAQAVGADASLLVAVCREGGHAVVVATTVPADGASTSQRKVVVPIGLGLTRIDARRLLGLPEPKKETAWYRRPWVWALAGAAAATAVIVPIATREETGDVVVHWPP